MNYSNFHNRANLSSIIFLLLYDTENADKLIHLEVLSGNNEECGRRSIQPLRLSLTKEYNDVSDHHQNHLLLHSV